jgi:hypothetical protein
VCKHSDSKWFRLMPSSRRLLSETCQAVEFGFRPMTSELRRSVWGSSGRPCRPRLHWMPQYVELQNYLFCGSTERPKHFIIDENLFIVSRSGRKMKLNFHSPWNNCPVNWNLF